VRLGVEELGREDMRAERLGGGDRDRLDGAVPSSRLSTSFASTSVSVPRNTETPW